MVALGEIKESIIQSDKASRSRKTKLHWPTSSTMNPQTHPIGDRDDISVTTICFPTLTDDDELSTISGITEVLRFFRLSHPQQIRVAQYILNRVTEHPIPTVSFSDIIRDGPKP